MDKYTIYCQSEAMRTLYANHMVISADTNTPLIFLYDMDNHIIFAGSWNIYSVVCE